MSTTAMLRLHVVSAVFQRNVKQFFNSVIGYLFIVVFVTSCAILTFNQQFFADNLANLDQLNKYFSLLLLFIIPAITMGIWADERKQGTDALLFTLPASDLEILLGKFLSVVAVYTIALLFSLTQLIPLAWLGNPDYGIIFTTYVGYWLAGIALLSIGMFASSLTRSSTIAFIVGALLCAIPVLIGYYFQGSVWLESLGISWHLRDFAIGLVSFPAIVYFCSIVIFMLYLNLVVISRRHWSRGQQISLSGHFAIRIGALAVALVALNFSWIRSEVLLPTRIDLTSERLFTVDKTTNITLEKAAKAKRVISIQAFVSSTVPREYVNLRKNLLSLLRQYDRIGGSNVRVHLVDVDPASDEGREAKAYGIVPKSVTSVVGGKKIEQDVYMGVVITSSLGETILPYIENGSSIEYELTRAIATSTDESKRLTIGVLDTDLHFDSFKYPNRQTGLIDTYDWGFGESYDLLQQHYNVENISLNQLHQWAGKIAADRRKAKAKENAKENDGAETAAAEKPSKQNSDEATAATENDTDDSDDSETASSETASENADALPDVLLIVGPSSLTNVAMLDLITYMEAGNPSLILADPLPVSHLVLAPQFYGIINAPTQPRIRPPNDWAVTTVSPDAKSNLGFSVKRTEHSDCIVRCLVRFTAANRNSFSAIFRYSDDNNYWRLRLTDKGKFQLVKRESGTDTVVDSKAIPLFDGAAPVEIEIRLKGDSIEWRSGMVRSTIDDSFNNRATAHGIEIQSDQISVLSYSISIVEKEATEFDDVIENEVFRGTFNGTCSLLCEKLGIKWRHDQVAWQLYNPHPGFEPTLSAFEANSWPESCGPQNKMLLFAKSYSDHRAFNASNEISKGLKELLFFYPGTISKRSTSNRTFEPLVTLKSNDSGLSNFEDVTTTLETRFIDRMTGEEHVRDSESVITGQPIISMKAEPENLSRLKKPPVIAARIRGKDLNVVFIADCDFVGNFYHKQAKQFDQLLDNITFLENSIESLASDSTFVRLRNRRPRPRTLTQFEKQTEAFRIARAKKEEQIESDIRDQLKQTEDRIKDLMAELGEDEDLSISQKAQSMQIGASSTLVKARIEKLRLEKLRQEELEKIRAEERQAMSRQESITRALSVLFAPLLPLVLGLIVFVTRFVSERAQVSPERRAAS